MTASKQVDFVLLGATGFIGSHILVALTDAEYHVNICPIRLEQVEQLKAYLEQAKPRWSVICAAGERGRPNVDWCLKNPCETVEANITGQLNLARITRELGIHCVFIGSGFAYPGALPDDRAKAGSFWREEEEILGSDYIDGEHVFPGEFHVEATAQAYGPEKTHNTLKTHIYRQLRCILEHMLHFYPNCLNLRVTYPVSMGDTKFEDKRSLLGKLRHFERIDKAETSVTFLDNLCPCIPRLCELRMNGDLNFMNPGLVRYADVAARLIVKLGIDKYNPEISNSPGRSNIKCDCTKLLDAMKGQKHKVMTADECLAAILKDFDA